MNPNEPRVTPTPSGNVTIECERDHRIDGNNVMVQRADIPGLIERLTEVMGEVADTGPSRL